MAANPLRNYPRKADIAKEIFRPLPIVSTSLVETQRDVNALADNVLVAFTTALYGRDPVILEDLFFTEQAYWKDSLAMTYHLRTFNDRGPITQALLYLNSKRKVGKSKVVPESPTPISLNETLVSPIPSVLGFILYVRWTIDGYDRVGLNSSSTSRPAARLLPVEAVCSCFHNLGPTMARSQSGRSGLSQRG